MTEEAFVRGVERFNALEFWEAHEEWEKLWLEAEGDLVEFYQGLIQLAAAYHHMKRGTYSGAVRLFDASLRRLEPFPSGFLSLDRTEAESAARRHRVSAENKERLDVKQYPKLNLASSKGS